MLPLPWLKEIDVIPDRRITDSRKPELVETLLQFFSVASPNEWVERYENLQGSFRCARKVDSRGICQIGNQCVASSQLNLETYIAIIM